jgi:dihydroxyacetone kinase-like protein
MLQMLILAVVSVNIDKSRLCHMLTYSSQILKSNKAYLSEIDSKFGDGDHGVTINKIADLIIKIVEAWNDAAVIINI